MRTHRLSLGSRVGLLLAVTGPLGMIFECARSASAGDCQSMAEHYVDLAVHESVGTATMSSAQVAAVRQVEEAVKHAEPTYRKVVDRCGDVDRAAVSCALRASTTAAWESCVRASDGRQ